MNFISIVFTALTLQVTILNGKNLPSLIKKCKRSDPYLNECMRKTIMDLRGYLRTGIKKLELVPMDPYVLPKAVVSTHWMNTTFENVTVYRMHTFEINSIRLDFDKNPFIVMDYYHPYLEINSHYRLDGNLLQIPIRGRGELESKYNNSKSFLSIDGHRIQKNVLLIGRLSESHTRLILVWFGVIFVRNGFYEDGVFRFNIFLPEDFPDGGHPKVVFQSNVFHPVIYKDTNELHVTDGFPTWDKDQHHIWQVLKYLSWIFYNFNSSLAHAVNLEAVNMYRNNQLEFKEKVKECVKYTQDHLYDPSPVDDKHYITFEKYIPSIHDSVRATMMTQSHEERIRASGYSWVSPGSFKPLSK
ncbi:ubiquitin-conjugating enzyme e2 [Holotrichia oblita]|uniref:Ubiquitin-conjugating enzyme e2 n=1 Tax=Holotrichia oblita TaxID=644536 RepID=A0ACB9TI58_HOLOL|nr:ubiquitin-conjugating enzyme e2 [Holotrichia oblita]